MKGFRTTIKGGFAKQALVNEWLPSRNTGMFVECKNVRGKPTGLEGYIPEMADLLSGEYPMIDAITSNPIILTRRWPFPQLFMTDRGLWIGAKEGLFYVGSSLVMHTAITLPIVLYDMGVYGYVGPIIWPWFCIPIPMYPAFCCGQAFVYYNNAIASYTISV